MTDEKNAGTFVEVDGKVGGPELTEKKDAEMAAEVAKNDPQDAKGPGTNMEPDHDLGEAFYYYEQDANDPARPETGLDTPHPYLADEQPTPQADVDAAGQAAADSVEDQVPQVPSFPEEYDMASTISAIQDEETTFLDLSTENMEGVTFARDIVFSGSTSFAPLMQALVEGFEEKFGVWKAAHPSLPMAKIRIDVKPTGTAQGLEDALDGEADFAMASCPVPYSTFERFGEFKEAFEIAQEVLTISVNTNNTLPSDANGGLSRDAYRQIFSGHLRTWDQVDDRLPEETINVYVRPDGNGAPTVFDAEIMKGTAISSDATVMGSARDLAPAIAKDPWAIGYAPLQDVEAINREHFKIAPLKVDGNEPDDVNLESRRYPLVLPFVIMTSRRADPFVRVFLEFIYGQEGWDIIHARGYHPSFKPGDTKQIYVSEPI